MKFYSGMIHSLKDNQVFVFGSNPEGRHGAGTAKVAREKFGAIYGQGRGIQGQAYALPTKNLKAGFKEKSTGIVYEKAGEKSLTKEQIIHNIKELYEFAKAKPEKDFFIAYRNESRNLNGYSSEDMLDMFLEAGNGRLPENMALSVTFKDMYREKTKDLSEEAPSEERDLNDFEITVVNIKKDKNAKYEKNYVYCGRGSALGNPSEMQEYTQAERDRVCEEYIVHINSELKKGTKTIRDQLNLIWKTGREHGEVKIGCYCAPQRCHCDTIKDILEKKKFDLKKGKKDKIETDPKKQTGRQP